MPAPFLSVTHRLELAASGITPEAAAAAGVYTETDPAAVGRQLNWPGPASAFGPCLVFPYRDAAGKPTGYCRVKPTRPRLQRRADNPGKAIKYEAPKGQSNRLYIPPGVGPALADPAEPLFITEGEKKALSAVAAGFRCVSVPGVWAWQVKRPRGEDGKATGPRKLIPDLAALPWKGRTVHLAFDSDAATNPKVRAAERAFVAVLTAAGARALVVRLPAGANAAKQGLDDFLVAHGPDALRQLVGSARPATEESDGATKPPSATDRLVALVLDEADLWHDDTGVAYTTTGRRSVPVRSKPFRQWLTHRYRAATGRVPSGDALTNAVNALDAEAVCGGPCRPVHVRLAGHDGRLYLHMADAADTVLEIGPGGWRACPDPPVRFRRVSGQLALPAPITGGSLEALRELLGLDVEPTFVLMTAFLCGAFLPRGPYPLALLHGEQGCGKSTVARVLKELLDPSAAPLRSAPKEDRDLQIAARHSRVLALDNLSTLPGWLSDALCRLATGGGFATRELYTDDGETVFDAVRPVILTGIEEVVTRGDLLERGLLFHLPPIPESRRMTETEFWAAFDRLHPSLLGALLDRVTGGLRALPAVTLGRLPRMADFARWVVACERGAGEPPRFLAIYAENQSGGRVRALDDSPVVTPLLEVLRGCGEWSGTATELLTVLGKRVPERRPTGWPKKPNKLTGLLRRLAPDLRQVHGVQLDLECRTGDKARTRIIRVWVDGQDEGESLTAGRCRTVGGRSEPRGPSEETATTPSGTDVPDDADDGFPSTS